MSLDGLSKWSSSARRKAKLTELAAALDEAGQVQGQFIADLPIPPPSRLAKDAGLQRLMDALLAENGNAKPNHNPQLSENWG